MKRRNYPKERPSVVFNYLFAKQMDGNEDFYVTKDQIKGVGEALYKAENAMVCNYENEISKLSLYLKLSSLHTELDKAEIGRLIGVLTTLEMHIRDLGANTDDDFVVLANAAIEQAKRHIS